jgi:hypothetical protein
MAHARFSQCDDAEFGSDEETVQSNQKDGENDKQEVLHRGRAAFFRS